MPILMAYSWPGNIRELENFIERAMVLATGRWITPVELPPSITADHGILSSADPEHTLSIKKSSRLLERNLIRQVLELTSGNRSRAAKYLRSAIKPFSTKSKSMGWNE